MGKISVFISYSHEDEIYKDKLEKHLSLLKRAGVIETWSDRKILAGEEWDKRIKSELESAQVILLLVSVDFLNSNYCYDVEIKRAVERHESGDAVVIPVILRKCDWHETAFSKIQALPKNAKPIKSFDDDDEAFYSIAEGIKNAVKDLKQKNVATEAQSSNNENPTLSIVYKIKSDCDTPPNILQWVGRHKEISEIDLDLHKVVYISGIGGQGKSGLASHYIKEFALRKGDWEFWDWRDCQEKENRIHTKIISIISRLTGNRINPKQISETSIDDLIELLFKELGSRKIVFVFDNIDGYIEFENFQLTGGVEKLYKAALNRPHNSKFIFTCRSSIGDVDPALLTLRLQGLSLDETKELFQDYNLAIQKDALNELAEKSYNLTKGHPLWLNLIAAQARRGLDVVENFLKGITPSTAFQEDSVTSILSNKILGTIWTSLNDKQKTLLMTFAEIVRAENQDNLSSILSGELNHNQFVKAFKALKQLNLVVVKSKINEQDTFELHPLVKEYIIQNIGRVERSKFISLFINFYDSAILILKPKLNSKQSLSFFENWTAKIELAVNKDDFKTALISLEEVAGAICDAGYVEEYIRVANLLYTTIDWKIALAEEYSYFNSQFTKFVDTLTEFGKFSEALAYLTKYEKQITNRGVNYIRYCKSKAHYFWFQGKLNEAISIAEEGIALEDQGVTKSGVDLKHTLALALRDTKDNGNIKKAVEIFLNDKEMSSLTGSDDDNFIRGETYGNVGRCLQFSGNIYDALICYKKSLRKLEDRMNIGYCYLWYAECMITNNQIDIALWFYMKAHNVWKSVSPIRASSVDRKIRAIIELNATLANISEMTEREVDRYCQNIIESN